MFEALLWPQRFYANFDLGRIPSVAVLTPMGGPLHKIALHAMDTFEHGLLRGVHQGHMLGTAFFHDQGWTYAMHASGDGVHGHTEPLRNCIWSRALTYIPIPSIKSAAAQESPSEVEKGAHQASSPLRARVALSHLTMHVASSDDKSSALPFVSEDMNTPGPRIFAAICASELSSVIVAVGVLAAYRALWAVLWLAPLLVRLACALSSVHREPLVSGASSSSEDPVCEFEIHTPPSAEVKANPPKSTGCAIRCATAKPNPPI
ncbi:hypothetical protein DL768_010255 [Monosporascus sp. mg162]|nr:hypothetical protein DL768_010255 [Monosporascus sp. mg162]